MKLEDQVLSIEQVQELQELGFDVSKYATLCWASCDKCPNEKCFERQSLELNMSKGKCCVNQTNFIPTLTIGDIIDILPIEIDEYVLDMNRKYVSYDSKQNSLYYGYRHRFIDSLFDCLVWCIKNNYITL